MMAVHSTYFMEAFFGQKTSKQVKIKDFSKDSFKIFLDSLFGLKEYTMSNALIIYPIAHQFGVSDSLQKCQTILMPEVLDDNVPLVLNLSTFYNNKKLINYVVDFIKCKCGVINFLEKKHKLLEPSAVSELVKNTELNSLLWTYVHLQKNNSL